MSRKRIQGTVKKIFGSTFSVEASRKIKHPKYLKTMKMSKRYLADSEIEGIAVDDLVEIEERSPISKKKCWAIIKKIKSIE